MLAAKESHSKRLEVSVEIGGKKREFHVFYDPEEGQFDKVKEAYSKSTLLKEKKADILVQQLKLYNPNAYSIEKTISITFA